MKLDPNSTTPKSIIDGRRVALGKHLAIASRGVWKRLIKEHGGHPIDQVDDLTDVLVVSDDGPALDDDANSDCEHSADPTRGSDRISVMAENELWQLLNSGVQSFDLSRFYTPSMLARILDVSVATIRRWHRRGLIVPAYQINKLPYFDFQEIASARRIAQWVQSGQSPASIERQLAQIANAGSGEQASQRSLSQLSIIIEGQRVLLRDGEGLASANGQLLFNFDDTTESSEAGGVASHLRIVGGDSDDEDAEGKPDEDSDSEQSSLPDILPFPQFADREKEKTPDELIAMAAELEDEGDLVGAVEVCRGLGLAHRMTPELSFRIAELLYQAGDLSAARERYYNAIELDEAFVEARANLGCLLVEMGQRELAVAAFRGALSYHRNFADVHFHLARLLDEMGQGDEAIVHWDAFLQIAPKSPWAEEAHDRIQNSKDW